MPTDDGNSGTDGNKPEGGKEGSSNKGGEQLGDTGIAALRDEREARAKAERDAAAARDELDKLKKSTQTDTEKALEEAKAAGRSEVSQAMTERLVKSEIKAAAGGKLADPADAPALLGDLTRFVDKSGDVDDKAISSAIDDLLKAKPYLAAQAPGSKPGALPGGGKKPAAGVSINDDIRARAGADNDPGGHPEMALITRAGSQALMPEDVATEILGDVADQSVIMGLGRKLPNMTRAQRRLPVWSTLPSAYFVNGDTGRKQTSNMSWDNVYINAEEIAVIVPIPEAVLDDADYDIWGEARPAIEQAIGAKFDNAVIFGADAPATWPECIVEQCDAKGHDVTEGQNGDLYDDLLGENGVLALIEEDGFMPNGHVAALRMRAKLRGLRDEDGQPIFKTTGDQSTAYNYTLDGEPLFFPKNGVMDPARALLLSGDWTQLVYAIRQDITYKVLTEATLTDGAGNVTYALAEQDMVALRVVIRLGWALPNPINLVNPDEDTRFPFAYYQPVAAS